MADVPSHSMLPTSMSLRTRLPAAASQIAGAVLFFAAYLALDKISYLDAPRPFAIMAWNPALGVCAAIVILWGRRALPLVFIAPFLAATLIRGFPLTVAYMFLVAVLTMAKVGLSVWGGARFAQHATNALLRNKQAAVLLAAVPVTLILNGVNALGLIATGLLPADKAIETIERLWIGDLIGVFVQTPFCLLVLAFTREKIPASMAWIIEVIVQTLLVAAMVWFIFGMHRGDASDYFYLLFLPMIWIVLNHGLNGAIVLNMLVQVSTISYLLLTGPAQTDLIFFQALTIVFVASSLTLGLSVDQSRAATQRLHAREQEVAATLKVAATSELAGALAHELSHPIGALANYAVALTQIVGKDNNADPALATIAGKLRQEARRATDTLRRLREFFRSGSLAMEPVDLNDLVRESVALIATRLSGRSILVRTTIDPVAQTVLAGRTQLLGVLHNLLLNAVEALDSVSPEHREILVTVERRGEDALIGVADSGPGIAPDIRDHMFEALTTTKSHGLGLGLSISRSIVQAHGGHIELGESDLGGAKFVISLPAERN